jgi:hypothetical protein
MRTNVIRKFVVGTKGEAPLDNFAFQFVIIVSFAARTLISSCLETRVTRLGEISLFGRFFMAKFFLEKIAQ